MPVDVVLGRDDVVLRGPDGEVVVTAPVASDLAGRGDGYHLDLPGDPLSPGCDYERWFDEVAAGVEPTVYARVATDADHPGRLALQYWFFWVYNDWNDKHEGDWEMVQLLFDASSAEEALASQPVTVAYAQHEGSETAAWSDPKVLKDGTHPVVYPGQGSHAAYFTQAQWFGRSAAAGFGCDDTRAPGTLLRPGIELLPEAVPQDASDPYAWLAFEGRWGQQAPSFNNGPTGPNAKTQWLQPVTWVEEEGRPDAVPLPALPGEAADAFCALTAGGSLLFVDLLDEPVVVVAAVVVVLVLVVVGIRVTRWRPTSIDPVDAQRRAGQVVTASVRLTVARSRTFLPLAALLFAAAALSVGLQAAALASRTGGTLVDVAGTQEAVPLAVAALVVTLLVTVPVALLVPVAAARATSDLAASGRSGAGSALGAVLRRPSSLVVALVQYVVPLLLVALLVLAPVGLWLMSRWAVAFPAAVAEGLGPRAALRRSRDLTRGHRWRTLALTALVLVGAGSVGPLLGGVLLLLTGLPFWVANAVAAAVGATLTVAAAVALTLQLFDLRGRRRG